MKMNKYSKIKLGLLVAIAIFTIASRPEQFASEPPPFFIYPVITIFTFLFSLGYFKGASTSAKLTAGRIDTFAHSILHDPLPYFHFIALACLVLGMSGICRAIILKTNIDPSSLFELSFGIGVYPSVLIANRKFIKETNVIG
jgi:hypothetical protein